MCSCLDKILKEKLIVIARGIPLDILLRATQAITGAGVHLLETTFDHRIKDPLADNAAKIKALRKAFGEKLLIGAGTVLSADEAQAAFDAGASYILAPNTNPSVIKRSKKLGMVSIPGAVTPTEICTAWDTGADIVKLFPADDVGFHYIQNIRGPLPHIPLLATGGVNPVTIPKFLELGVAAVGTGITILRPDLVAKQDYEGIATLAKMHVDAVRLR